MSILLSERSLIDAKYYKIASGEEVEDKNRFNLIANSVISFMERYCDRPLKARDYSYDPLDVDEFDPEMTIFDGPLGNVFWFPLYPVNSITKFIISLEEIAEASELNPNGYILYSGRGKLIYDYGFSYGEHRNVKVKYNAGFTVTDREYPELQNIQYTLTKKFQEEDTTQSGIMAETIGNYRYVKASPKDLAEYLDLPVFIFKALESYKRTVIA